MWPALSRTSWCGAGHRAAARPQIDKTPPRRALFDLGRGTRAWPTRKSLAYDQVAGRRSRLAVLAIFAHARPWCPSRCARMLCRVAHRHGPAESQVEEWLLIEWPEGEKKPTKYWLSTLPEDISFRKLVDITKLRWRIERDYQELKQEVGLGHYEGRGWRGFHHHATLCIAAYGFLVSERETIPPSGPPCATFLPQLAFPDGYRPRGAAATAWTACPRLNRNPAPAPDRRARRELATMSMLRRSNREKHAAQKFVMQ